MDVEAGEDDTGGCLGRDFVWVGVDVLLDSLGVALEALGVESRSSVDGVDCSVKVSIEISILLHVDCTENGDRHKMSFEDNTRARGNFVLKIRLLAL